MVTGFVYVRALPQSSLSLKDYTVRFLLEDIVYVNLCIVRLSRSYLGIAL